LKFGRMILPIISVFVEYGKVKGVFSW